MTASEYLRQYEYAYYAAERARQTYELEMERIDAIGSTLGENAGMPRGSGTGNQVEDGAILIEYARQAMDNITTELEGMRAELTPLIESLESPLQKNAMWMRYIEGHSVREIAYSLNYSEQHIFRILQIAERKIQKNESCESS
jgi:DNA-directed RNA polymerase specialized sigma subunit